MFVKFYYSVLVTELYLLVQIDKAISYFYYIDYMNILGDGSTNIQWLKGISMQLYLAWIGLEKIKMLSICINTHKIRRHYL